MTIIRYDSLLRVKFLQLLTDYFDELDAGLSRTAVAEKILPMLEDQDELRIGTIILAFRRGRPIGFAVYQIDSPRSDWCKRPGWGCIREFYIRPEYRRQGYGARMAGYAEKHLRKLGAEQLYLTADSAIPFWEKSGWRNTGELCSNDCFILEK